MKIKLMPTLFSTSLVGFIVGWYLSKVYDCGQSVFCYWLFTRIGDPLFFGMGALALVFLVLLFVPRAFSAWWKFAIWFVPLATVVFIFVPEPSGWVSPLPAPEQVFQWVSGAYVIISLAIVGWARKS